jgi:dCMP deaminase
MIDKWDKRFIELAKHISTWSKDPSRKFGCVIVDDDRVIVSIGYNGFPRGVIDDNPKYWERPDKYLRAVHSEENAVINAARTGVSVKNCTAYVNGTPCASCARKLINAGVKRIVGFKPNIDDPTYKKDFEIAQSMYDESKISFETLDEIMPDLKNQQ